jgi:ligand-binding SRPBCC domain-containing protein
MGFYQFKRTQQINEPINTVWQFISNPKNLKIITPDYMGFDILSKDIAPTMYAGMIISYKVAPLLNINMQWVTEITHIKENNYFVDEQRVGPYKIWHHQHILEPAKNGTKMIDIVSYKPPFGFIGNLAHPLIERKLKEIFNYRSTVLSNLFN